MSTLSFSCPQCQKEHRRLKPELAGHKVKCQCGFVFRLGSKEDKLVPVVPKLRRGETPSDVSNEPKQTSSRNGSEENQNPNPSPDSNLSDEVLDLADLELIMEPIEVAVEVPQTYNVSLEEEFFVKPIGAVESNKTHQEEVPILVPVTSSRLPIADLFSDSTAVDVQAPSDGSLASGTPTESSQPEKKPVENGQKTQLDSALGPTVSLVVSVLGLISMIAVLSLVGYALGRSLDQQQTGNLFVPEGQKGWLAFAMIRTVAILVVGSLLGLSIVASGVTAVMEMTQKRKIGWAHKLSAILATIFMLLLLVYLVSSLMQVYGVANDAQFRVNQAKLTRTVVITVLSTIGMGLAPLLVAITGFARGRK